MGSNWVSQPWLILGIFGVSVSTLIYTIVSNYAIRGNDLKHIIKILEDIVKRVERLEDIFIKGGKEK